MESANTIALTTREITAMLLLIVSIAFVIFSVFTNLLLEASEPMMMVSFAAILFSILPILSILTIRRKKKDPELKFLNSVEQKEEILKKITNSVRVPALIFGLLMLLFTIGSALTAYEIYEPDIPGGVILALSGFLALGGAAFYQRDLSNIAFSYLPPTPPPHTHETEIIREKEVIVKVRCQYCGNTFDETLDQCTTCGAKK